MNDQIEWYAVIGGPWPGVVQGIAEARRRTNKVSGTYMKRGPALVDAAAYYLRTVGHPPPEVRHAASPFPKLRYRITIEGPRGKVERVPTDHQLEALEALGLLP